MKKCLIIDDSDLSRTLCSAIINSINLEAKECTNFEDAIKVCKEDMPDLIILDLIIPETNGITILQEIRNLKNGNKPYILICSAKNKAEDVQKAMNAGANSYYTKPVKPELLKKRLEEIIIK